MNALFDVEDVEAALQTAVVERGPEFVYQSPDLGNEWGSSCYYTHPDGSAGCIVGKVAEVLGVPLPEWDSPSNRGFIADHPHFREFFTHEALERLGRVQSLQDQRQPWGRAVTAR